MHFASSLDFKPREATSLATLAFGKETRLPTPDRYRTFLLETGGGYLRDGLAECVEPTPFGEMNITELADVRGITNMLGSRLVPKTMICIGSGHFGMLTCLVVKGSNCGSVYALDTEMRRLWTDEDLRKRPHLRQSIKEFFVLRDTKQLAEHPDGHTHCYLSATSFEQFVSKLRSADDD